MLAFTGGKQIGARNSCPDRTSCGLLRDYSPHALQRSPRCSWLGSFGKRGTVIAVATRCFSSSLKIWTTSRSDLESADLKDIGTRRSTLPGISIGRSKVMKEQVAGY